MYRRHRYNLIRFDLSTADTAYKLFVKSINDYVIVKEVTVSDVTVRTYFIAYKNLETNWSNRASLTYSADIQDKKLVNEGQNWFAAATGITFTGLLDLYKNAAAAYSLTRLSKDYKGAAIEVRRDSDNTTLDIGFNGVDLDVASLEAFCNPNTVVAADMNTDSNSDGLLDDFIVLAGRGTPSLVTGNGHIGQAQRLDGDATGLAGIYSDIFPLIIGQEITISFMYRSNIAITLTNGTSVTQFPSVPINIGNAIRYEETSIWNPTIGVDGRITFSWLNNASQWYEISDLSVTVHTANGYVTKWYDQSGNGFDAIQTTASLQPKIVSAGSTLLVNGKPSINFNGTLIEMDLTTAVNTDSVFSVYKVDDLTQPVNYLLFNSSPISGLYVNANNDANKIGVYDGSLKSSSIVATNNQTLITYIYNTNYNVAVDGSSLDAIPTATTKLSVNKIGRSSNFDLSIGGTVQSIIIYDSDQSSNRIAIEENINSYYNIFPVEQTILSYYVQRVEADGGQVEAQPYVLQTITDLNN